MSKRRKPKVTEKQASAAAATLGNLSWQCRIERFGLQQSRERLVNVGKLGGRPRKTENDTSTERPIREQS